MDDKLVFNCAACGNTMEVVASESNVPECCEKPMQKGKDLTICDTSTTAEHARLDDFGEPCDDGRAGKI